MNDTYIGWGMIEVNIYSSLFLCYSFFEIWALARIVAGNGYRGAPRWKRSGSSQIRHLWLYIGWEIGIIALTVNL